MPTKTRLIPLKWKLGLAAALIVSAFGYQTISNMGGPRIVHLSHSWHTERGINNSFVFWEVTNRYTGDVVIQTKDGAGEPASGGVWRRDVVLPGPGTFNVVLAGSPVRVRQTDGSYRGASSTCVIEHEKQRVADSGSSAPNDGCAINMIVLVGPTD